MIFEYDFEVIDKILNTESAGQKRPIQCSDESSSKRPCLVEINTNCMNDKIQKRNARERNRVKLVNHEFDNLRQILLQSEFCRDYISNGCESTSNDETNDSINSINSKRFSKLKILRTAIEYINHLSSLLQNSETSDLDFLDLSNHDLLELDLIDVDLSCFQASSPNIDYLFQ